jgi:glucosylceramidase
LLAAVCAALAAIAATASTPTAEAALPTVQVWLTKADGSANLAQQASITLGPVSRGSINVAVDDSRSYQTISGFGAAFTDSSASLMAQLKSSSPSTYNTMMNDLFSTSSGIDLAFWRIPMTSSDFTGNTDDGTAVQEWAAGVNNPNQGGSSCRRVNGALDQRVRGSGTKRSP